MENTKLYLSKPGIMSCAGKNIDELWESVINCNQTGIQKVTTMNGEEHYAARIDASALPPANARFEMKIMRIENAALEQIKDDVNTVVEKSSGPTKKTVKQKTFFDQHGLDYM